MTKHSQRTDWHSGVDYRVWGDENIYPDPPNFHLSGKWQFGLCPHSELDVTRDQCTGSSSGSGIIFLLRSGKEMRRGGCHDIQCQDWPQLGADASLQSPDWQGWSQYYPLPPPPSHWLHICRENICWAQRARGRMRPPGGNGEPGSEGLVARRGECQTVITEPDTSQLQSAVMTPGQ